MDEAPPPDMAGGHVPPEMNLWKTILAALLPVLGLALAGAFLFWYRQRRHKAKRDSELERMSTMLDDFRTKTADVEALSHELQAGVDRVRKLETELKVNTANLSMLCRYELQMWLTLLTGQSQANAEGTKGGRSLSLSSPSPLNSQLGPFTPTPLPGAGAEASAGSHELSEQTTSGTLPPSARGLEHLERSRTGSDSTASAVFHERYVPYTAPSTIPEESSAGVSSPFDTPGRDNSPLLQNPDGSYRFLHGINAREVPHNGSTVGHRDFLTSLQLLSPLRANPSHPDLVPQPLAVVKRNSTLREPSSETPVLVRVRRSYSDATAGRGYIRAKEDSQLASPTPMARGQVQAKAKARVQARSDTPPSMPAISGEFSALLSGRKMATGTVDSPTPEAGGLDPFATPNPSVTATTSEADTTVSSTKSRPVTPRRRIPTPRPFYESEMGWRTYH